MTFKPCVETTEEEIGTVYKEGGPRVIVYTREEIGDKFRTVIHHDTVHAMEIEIGKGEIATIGAYMSSKGRAHEMRIHMWFSDGPYGQTIPRAWRNLNIISLIRHPTYVYISEESVPKGQRPDDDSLVVVPAGTYYVNFHNRRYDDSRYTTAISIRHYTDTSSPDC